MKITISTTSFGKYDKAAIELCKKNGYKIIFNSYGRRITSSELVECARDSVGLIAGTESLTEDVLMRLPFLKVISRCGTGLDNVDLKAAKKRNIKVFNTPNAPILPVAELTVGLVFSMLRDIPFMDKDVKAGLWKKRMGSLLCNKKVGIIGFGKIGKKVAELLNALGAKVSYNDPGVSGKDVRGFKKVNLKELLAKSDIITLNLSYSKENAKLLNKKMLSLMKKSAFLVNCSRGGIVDEKVLYSLLKNRKIAGAAMDVFEKEPYNGPLKKLKNVILTPHIGSYAKEARIQMERQAVDNLLIGLKMK